MDIIILVVGFLLLVKGADFFVEGSASIAKKLNIPTIVIGLTLVAFGTSAPELAVSVDAALEQSNGLVFGNVIGSNIANTLFILGVAAAISPIKVPKSIIIKEIPFLIIATSAMIIMSIDSLIDGTVSILSRTDGILLLIFFLIYFYSMIELAFKGEANDESEEIAVMSIPKSLLYTSGGLVGIIFGANLTVKGAISIAELFGLSDTLIGLTVIAIGTSLPELITSVVAAKKGESDIAVGNVIGSNVFNILLVLGVSATINPIMISNENYIDLVILFVVMIGTVLLMFKGRNISKNEGRLMVLVYFIYMAYLIFRTLA